MEHIKTPVTVDGMLMRLLPSTVIAEFTSEGDSDEAKQACADAARAINAHDALVVALDESRIAIDDWLNTYASELCGEARVEAAHKRISDNGGTLAYIASIQEQNRAALKLAKGGE